MAKTDEALEKRISRFNSTFEKGGDWFENFADDATVYTIGSAAPFKGRAAYQRNFEKLLKEKRKVNEIQRDVQVMGDTAVVMQLLEITQSKVTTVLRQSTIWRNYDGDWKAIHMHCASVGAPVLSEIPRDAKAIQVLAGRIATVSAQVGVAQ